MYNLIEYSDNYSKTFRFLYQFYGDDPIDLITDSESFKFKSRFLNNTNNTVRYYKCRNSYAIKILIFGELLKCFWLIAKSILF